MGSVEHARRASRASAAFALSCLFGCTSLAGLDGDYTLGVGGASGDPGATSSTSSSQSAGPGGGPGAGGMAASSGGATSSSTSSGAGGAGGKPMPVCGDGAIDTGEECDDGPGSPSPYCEGCDVICDGQWEVEDPQTHHCYYDTVSDGMHYSWQNGRSFCQNMFDGDLVVISNAAELAFLQSLAPNQYDEDRWIGATDEASENAFEWVNGEQWTYAGGQPPWGSGEPGGDGGENCVVLRHDGTLAEVWCAQGWTHHMCERVPDGN